MGELSMYVVPGGLPQKMEPSGKSKSAAPIGDDGEGVKSQAYGKLRSAMKNRFTELEINASIAKLESQADQLQEIVRDKYQIKQWLVDLVCDRLKGSSGSIDVLSGVEVKLKDLERLIKSDVTKGAYDKVIGNNDGKYGDAVQLGKFTQNIMEALEFEGDVSDDPIQGLRDLLGSNKIILVDEKEMANYFNASLSEHLQLKPGEVPPGNPQLLELLNGKYSRSYLSGALLRVMRSGRNMSDSEGRSRAGIITLCWFVSHDKEIGKYAYKIYHRGDKKSDHSDEMTKVYGAAFEWGLEWDKEPSPKEYLKGIYKGIKIEMKNVSDNAPDGSFAVPAGQPKTEDKKL